MHMRGERLGELNKFQKSSHLHKNHIRKNKNVNCAREEKIIFKVLRENHDHTGRAIRKYGTRNGNHKCEDGGN